MSVNVTVSQHKVPRTRMYSKNIAFFKQHVRYCLFWYSIDGNVCYGIWISKRLAATYNYCSSVVTCTHEASCYFIFKSNIDCLYV